MEVAEVVGRRHRVRAVVVVDAREWWWIIDCDSMLGDCREKS